MVQVTKKFSDKNEANLGSLGVGKYMGEVPILLDIPISSHNSYTWIKSSFTSKERKVLECFDFLYVYDWWNPTNHGAASLIYWVHVTRTRKSITLGRLASGLAYELNNPASAASSSSTQLKELFQTFTKRSMKFAQYSQVNKLTNDQLDILTQ
jgi:hypothetical protein